MESSLERNKRNKQTKISMSCTESSMKSMKLTLRNLISDLSLHVTRVYSMRMR